MIGSCHWFDNIGSLSDLHKQALYVYHARIAEDYLAVGPACQVYCLLMMQARVFQNSKDALSGGPLELPAVHFVCGHSFNLRSLGENEKECPLCAPQFRAILDIKRAMRSGATEQASCGHCLRVDSIAAARVLNYWQDIFSHSIVLPTMACLLSIGSS